MYALCVHDDGGRVRDGIDVSIVGGDKVEVNKATSVVLGAWLTGASVSVTRHWVNGGGSVNSQGASYDINPFLIAITKLFGVLIKACQQSLAPWPLVDELHGFPESEERWSLDYHCHSAKTDWCNGL